MKKFYLVSVFATVMCLYTQGQTVRPTTVTKKVKASPTLPTTVPASTPPAPTTPTTSGTPATTTPATPTTTNPPSTPPATQPVRTYTQDEQDLLKACPGYYISKVMVRIGSGEDGKERFSKVHIQIIHGNREYDRSSGATFSIYNNVPYLQDDQIFLPNTTSSHELFKQHRLPTTYAHYKYSKPDEFRYPLYMMSLGTIQAYGLTLVIRYTPNFFLDAWKIDNVSMDIEFNNILGEPHPTMSKKTVHFTTVKKLLKQNDEILILKMDQFLFPKL